MFFCVYFSYGTQNSIGIPNSYQYKKIQYKDTANECFNFTAKIVSCKGKDAKEIPIQ